MTDDDLYDDDNFGLDDFDDLDDDFDFDEFDDDAKPAAPQQAATQNASGGSYEGYGRTEQTFLQKYFYAIVAFVALALAGLWFLGQNTSKTPNRPPTQAQSSQSQNTDNASALGQPPSAQSDIDALLASDSDLPMPVPLNSFAEDEALPVYKHREHAAPTVNAPNTNTPNSADKQMYDPGILTPLPDGAGIGYGDDTQDNTFANTATDSTKNAMNNALDGIPNNAPSVTDIIDVEPDIKSTADNKSSDNFESLFTQNPGMTLSVKQSDLDGTKTIKDTNTDKPSVLDAVQNMLDGNAAPKTTPPTRDIGAIKTELSSVSESLSKRIETTDTKLDDLAMVLKSLEQKIDRLDSNAAKQAAAVQNTTAVKQAARAPTTIKSPIKTTTTTTTKTPAKTVARSPVKTKKKAPRITWQLRSAQTGKAVVARKGTNDFRTVEVGTTLSGIGKIKSVMLENGRWVVRGSQGKITQ